MEEKEKKKKIKELLKISLTPKGARILREKPTGSRDKGKKKEKKHFYTTVTGYFRTPMIKRKSLKLLERKVELSRIRLVRDCHKIK